MVDQGQGQAPLWWINVLASQFTLLLGEGALFFVLVVYRSSIFGSTGHIPVVVAGFTLTVALYLVAGLVAGSRLPQVGQWFALASGAFHWFLWYAIETVIGKPLTSSHWAFAFTSLPPITVFLTLMVTLTAAAAGGWLSSRKC